MKHELENRILSSIFLAPFSLFFIIKGLYFLNIFMLICLIISFYEWYLMSKNKFYNIPGYLFLLISFSTLYIL